MQRAVFAAAAFALAITPISFAASPSPKDVEPFKFEVFYDNEQLATAQGVERTYKQISTQVRDACRDNSVKGRSIAEIRQNRVCTAESLDRTVKAIGHADLTAYHQAMTNG
ncbi:MAG: UrcA family protein [Pseudomonadota bacterium]